MIEQLQPKQESEKTKLEALFDLFLSTESIRPDIQRAYRIENKIYASNGYVLICCDEEHCDFEITNKHFPVLPPMPIPHRKTKVVVDKSAFEQYINKDRCKNTKEDLQCSVCDGYGSVSWKFLDYEQSDLCPECEGTGNESKRMIAMAKENIFGDAIVRVDNADIKMSFFYRVIKAQEILGGDVFLVYLSEYTIMFEVSYCKILMMRLPVETSTYGRPLLVIS